MLSLRWMISFGATEVLEIQKPHSLSQSSDLSRGIIELAGTSQSRADTDNKEVIKNGAILKDSRTNSGPVWGSRAPG